MNFSLEITMKTDISTLPKVKDVYITMLPGDDFKKVASKALELIKSGFNPVPHFPARSIKNIIELKDYVKICKDGGVKQVLVIGGGAQPAGDFNCSLQILETGLFEGFKVGIAGHPEGSPDIPKLDLEKAMKDKISKFESFEAFKIVKDEGQYAIKARWVYSEHEDQSKGYKLKSRLCMRGDTE